MNRLPSTRMNMSTKKGPLQRKRVFQPEFFSGYVSFLGIKSKVDLSQVLKDLRYCGENSFPQGSTYYPTKGGHLFTQMQT